MRSSKLDRTLIIERRTVAVNDYGVEQETWEPITTIRAELVQSMMAEHLGDFGTTEEPQFVFRTRYWPDVTLEDRINYNPNPGTVTAPTAPIILNVVSISEIPRRKGLEIRCAPRGA